MTVTLRSVPTSSAVLGDYHWPPRLKWMVRFRIRVTHSHCWMEGRLQLLDRHIEVRFQDQAVVDYSQNWDCLGSIGENDGHISQDYVKQSQIKTSG